MCHDWHELTAPDSSAWEDLSVELRPFLPLYDDYWGTEDAPVPVWDHEEAVDRTPFLEWLKRRVDVLRRVQILTLNPYPGQGVRCHSTMRRASCAAVDVTLARSYFLQSCSGACMCAAPYHVRLHWSAVPDRLVTC